MSRAKIVDYYIQKVAEENLDIDQVRKELAQNNVDEEEIKIIVRLVDNEVQRRMLTGSYNRSIGPLIGAGIIVTTVGAGITIMTYTGLLGSGTSFVIAYGPFLSGLSLLFAGLAKRRH